MFVSNHSRVKITCYEYKFFQHWGECDLDLFQSLPASEEEETRLEKLTQVSNCSTLSSNSIGCEIVEIMLTKTNVEFGQGSTQGEEIYYFLNPTKH